MYGTCYRVSLRNRARRTSILDILESGRTLSTRLASNHELPRPRYFIFQFCLFSRERTLRTDRNSLLKGREGQRRANPLFLDNERHSRDARGARAWRSVREFTCDCCESSLD